MRECSKCKTVKPLTDFYVSGGRRRSDCKVCHKLVMRPRSHAHYLNNKPYYRARNRSRSKDIATFIRQYKTDHPICLDCKLAHPYWRLDFDHTRGRKLLDLSRVRTNGWGLEKILEEIAKCDLVCANCHRDRTFHRLCTKQGSNLPG